MREVISYKEMITNLNNPKRMWGDYCPFFHNYPKKIGDYFEIDKNGKTVCVNDNPFNNKNIIYSEAVYFWKYNKSSTLITKMITIIKELQIQS